MALSEQEMMQEIERLRKEVNRLSLIVAGLLDQYSQDGRSAIIKTKGGTMDFSPRPPRILNESDSEGNWNVRLDYGT